MVKNDAQHPAVTLLAAAVGVLDTDGLLELSQAMGDELLSRAHKEGESRMKRLLHLAAVHLVEFRGRLRFVRALEVELENASAAPPPDSQRGAVEPGPGASPFVADCQPVPGTTGGAAESLRRCDDPTHHGFGLVALQCAHCKDDLGHEGECRPVEGPETAPLSPSLSRPELQGRGPRGPEAAEGAGEAGRAKQGPVDLAHHLALLKGGAA